MKVLFNLPSQSLKNQNKPAQKHQSIPKMNQRPQDTVSFGMAKLSAEGLQKLAKEAKVAPIVKIFIEDLNNLIKKGDNAKLMKTLDNLASKDELVIENVVLHQDKETSNRSFLHKMLDGNLTEASSKFIDIVNSLKNEEVKGQFHLLINNHGQSHLNKALYENNTEIVERIADNMLRIVPEEFAKIKFNELPKAENDSFYINIGQKVAGCENLSKYKTLDFLNNNRNLPQYQRFSKIVSENAVQ